MHDWNGKIALLLIHEFVSRTWQKLLYAETQQTSHWLGKTWFWSLLLLNCSRMNHVCLCLLELQVILWGTCNNNESTSLEMSRKLLILIWKKRTNHVTCNIWFLYFLAIPFSMQSVVVQPFFPVACHSFIKAWFCLLLSFSLSLSLFFSFFFYSFLFGMLASDSSLADSSDIDVHAPAQTYYTTGNNAGSNINRLRTLSVSLWARSAPTCTHSLLSGASWNSQAFHERWRHATSAQAQSIAWYVWHILNRQQNEPTFLW